MAQHINPEQKRKYNQKVILYRMISYICMVIIIAIYASYFIISQNLKEGSQLPFFYQHFANPIGMASISVIAFILPRLNSLVNLQGDHKGDKLMTIVSIVLFAAAIGTLIFSFVG